VGAVSFLLGSIVGQLSGAWVYWRVRSAVQSARTAELGAAAVSGAVTAVIASAAYLGLGIHTWAGGVDAHWGLAVFLGVCLGICQAVLFRGNPLAPPTDRGVSSKMD